MEDKTYLLTGYNAYIVAKKGFYLDSETIDIVEKTEPKKQSDFVRKAIKFYHYNKDRQLTPQIMKGEVVKVG